MVYHDLGMLGAYKKTLSFFSLSLSPHLGPAGMNRFFQTLGEQKQDWTEKQLEDALREQTVCLLTSSSSQSHAQESLASASGP